MRVYVCVCVCVCVCGLWLRCVITYLTAYSVYYCEHILIFHHVHQEQEMLSDLLSRGGERDEGLFSFFPDRTR